MTTDGTTGGAAGGAPTSPDPEERPGEPAPVDPAEERRYERGPSRGPALIVVGIAVAILLFGGIASLVTSDSGPKPAPARTAITLPNGTSVATVPAATALKAIVSGGQPPADILSNLVLPKGSKVTNTVNADQNMTQYSRTAYFVSGSSELSGSEAAGFFRSMFKQLGWDTVYDAQATNPSLGGASMGQNVTGMEILAKRGSTDGYYWEAGAVIPDQGSGDAAVSSSGSSSTTPFILQIFEVPDAE